MTTNATYTTLFTTQPPVRRRLRRAVYYGAVACMLWASSQLIGLLFNATGIVTHVINNQAGQHPAVHFSPLAGTLFGLLAFGAIGALILALYAAARWRQRTPHSPF